MGNKPVALLVDLLHLLTLAVAVMAVEHIAKGLLLETITAPVDRAAQALSSSNTPTLLKRLLLLALQPTQLAEALGFTALLAPAQFSGDTWLTLQNLMKTTSLRKSL